DVHRPSEPVVWFAFQADDDLYIPTLHVRGRTAETAGLTAAGRGELDRVARGFPVFNIRTLAGRIEDAIGRERMIANISAGFGVGALLVGALGVYGASASGGAGT